MLMNEQLSILYYNHFFSPHSDVDDVHEMMDDIQEQTELADEISRAISEPAGFGMDVDEVSIQNVNATFHNEFVATLMLSFFNPFTTICK